MNYLLLTLFGILPSLVWLLFFLRKDSYPESNRMVLKIFISGMLATVPAILLEIGILSSLKELELPLFLPMLANTFIGIALVEEMLKYWTVRTKVLSHPEFDEPIDAMLYMIIAALGFATLENVLILFSLNSFFPLKEIIAISALRFLGATFLHALCSGMIGYFIALSIFETKKRNRLLFSGIAIATLLHGFYNFSIIETEGIFSFLIPVIILTGLAIFAFFAFKKLKKTRSTCKI